MPFFNQGDPFIGVNDNPLKESVYVRQPDEKSVTPPPGFGFFRLLESDLSFLNVLTTPTPMLLLGN